MNYIIFLCIFLASGSIYLAKDINLLYPAIVSGSITVIGWYVGLYFWKKQEILKIRKESGLKFLSFLERYSLGVNTVRNGTFQFYDTEESIYQERWNHLIKIWIELQNEYTLIKLLFPEQKEKITKLSELQSELKANLDTYLDRKRRGSWIGDESDMAIKKILLKLDGIPDEFGEKIQNEIDSLSDPIKTQLKKQFNIKF